jgi:phosphatidylglycerophosphate synthase
VGEEIIAKTLKNRSKEYAGAGRENETSIRIWTIVHSILCLLFGFFFYWGKGTSLYPFLNLGFVFYGYLIFALLFSFQKKNVLTIQNIISTLRLFIGLMVFLWLNFQPYFSLWKFLLLVIAAVTDFIDGRVAQSRGITRFGARLDMELDAFFILILSFIGFIYGDFGSWLLWIGGMRYIYEFFLIFLPPITAPRGLPRIMKYSEKAICAFAVISLVSITAPFFPQTGKIFINRGALALLTVSFLLNFLIHLFQKKSQKGNNDIKRGTWH